MEEREVSNEIKERWKVDKKRKNPKKIIITLKQQQGCAFWDLWICLGQKVSPFVPVS